MIGRLTGAVVERRALTDASVDLVVDVGGVGYRVVVTPRTAAGIPLGVNEVVLAVHTHVREGAITLYGFSTSDERSMFEALITAHGVGPGLALAILGVHDPTELAEIVAGGDVDALKLVPGVGAKTAARLLLELRARLDHLTAADLGVLDDASGPRASSTRSEVSEALAQLGYGPEEVREALRALPGEGSASELLAAALRSMAPKR